MLSSTQSYFNTNTSSLTASEAQRLSSYHPGRTQSRITATTMSHAQTSPCNASALNDSTLLGQGRLFLRKSSAQTLYTATSTISTTTLAKGKRCTFQLEDKSFNTVRQSPQVQTTNSKKRISFNLPDRSANFAASPAKVAQVKGLHLQPIEKATLYRWAISLGVIDGDVQARLNDISRIDEFAMLCANGSIFVRLIERIAGLKGCSFVSSGNGVFLHAKNAAQVNVNYLKMFGFLRRQELMNARFLNCEAQLKAGDAGIFWGFLNDLQVWSSAKKVSRNSRNSSQKRNSTATSRREEYDDELNSFDYESICSSQHAKQQKEQHAIFKKIVDRKKGYTNVTAQLMMHPTNYANALTHGNNGRALLSQSTQQDYSTISFYSARNGVKS